MCSGTNGPDVSTSQRRPWIEHISWKPRAFIIHNLITDAEAVHIASQGGSACSRQHRLRDDIAQGVIAGRRALGTGRTHSARSAHVQLPLTYHAQRRGSAQGVAGQCGTGERQRALTSSPHTKRVVSHLVPDHVLFRPAAAPSMKRSTVVGANGSSVEDDYRTSFGTFLNRCAPMCSTHTYAHTGGAHSVVRLA